MSGRVHDEEIVNATIPVSAIDAHPDNYNQHPEAQIAQLAASHEAFGQYRSIVVVARPGGRYVQVAGHGYLQAAKGEGMTHVRADVLPMDTDETTIKAIMAADNLHAQNSSPDDAVLARLLQEQVDAGYDLSSLGTDEEALRQMLDALGDEYAGGGGDDSEDGFDAEPDEEQTRVKLGDVWRLGRHMIGCVDSCDGDAVQKLVGGKQINFVFADPPYGISIVATNGYVGGGEAYDIPFGGVKNTPVIGDETITTAMSAFDICYQQFTPAVQIWWGANYYAHALPPSSCWVVWDKENTGNFADAELAWCSDKSAVRIFKHMWNGLMKDSEKGQRRVHPTQKPIALAEWCYGKYGKEEDVIFDPFLGSGMSLIAAENTNRTVIGCELSPEYISIILTRWENRTGQTAQLIERIEEAEHAKAE